jgi:hypothetical protein
LKYSSLGDSFKGTWNDIHPSIYVSGDSEVEFSRIEYSIDVVFTSPLGLNNYSIY